MESPDANPSVDSQKRKRVNKETSVESGGHSTTEMKPAASDVGRQPGRKGPRENANKGKPINFGGTKTLWERGNPLSEPRRWQRALGISKKLPTRGSYYHLPTRSKTTRRMAMETKSVKEKKSLFLKRTKQHYAHGKKEKLFGNVALARPSELSRLTGKNIF